MLLPQGLNDFIIIFAFNNCKPFSLQYIYTNNKPNIPIWCTHLTRLFYALSVFNFFFTSLLIIIHYSFFNSIFFSFSFSLRLFFFLSTGSELFLRINNIVKPNIYSYITYYTIIFEKKYVQFLKVVLELYFN